MMTNLELSNHPTFMNEFIAAMFLPHTDTSAFPQVMEKLRQMGKGDQFGRTVERTTVSFTIAVSGKGGTGKTTLAGMIIRHLLDKGKRPILAVDADSNSNLNEVLGVEVRSTIGEARELMKKDVPAGMTKDIWFEYKVQEALIEAKGFDLIAMGRPEGPGCYCAANTLARKCLDLLTGNYRYIVIDNEAGMEHFSRLTTRDVDLLFILSDPSRRGILTAVADSET